MAPFLMKKITKDVDTAVQEFCKNMADKYGICAEEAFTQWKVSQQKPAVSVNAPKKRTPFVMFSMSIRALILEENPDFSFGDVSKETGRRWKLLSDDEKKKYAITPDVVSAVSVEEAVAVAAVPAPKKKKAFKTLSTAAPVSLEEEEEG
jgi:predicted transcriptional regulator